MSMLCGCGDSDQFVPVTGVLTLDDSPLADAYVVFEPIGGTAQQASSGKTDAEGRFELSVVQSDQIGALVGEHRIRMTTVAPDSMQDERSELPKDRVPARFQRNPPIISVSAENNELIQIELESAPK